MTIQKCNICKKTLNIAEFRFKKNQKYTKACIKCLDRVNARTNRANKVECRTCSMCKKELIITEFRFKKDRTYTKACIKCLDRVSASRINIETDSKKCPRCKKQLTFDKYTTTPNGELTKYCTQCLLNAKQKRIANKCEHNKDRGLCVICDPRYLCEHNIAKSSCRLCLGGGICECGIRRERCLTHGGSAFCEHLRLKQHCKEGSCRGVGICIHDRVRSRCKLCGGGSVCFHGKQRVNCASCKGGNTCIHKKIRHSCSICDPIGHFVKNIRTQVWAALKQDKTLHATDYIGCDIETFRKHLEDQFTEGMTWDNYGEWHIDHIIPVKYNEPSMEQVIERLHYTNTQPMWASENESKGNRYIGQFSKKKNIKS